jgi:flavin-dependent thymidylate synthase
MTNEIVKYSDAAMYKAEPMEEPGEIKVHLLWMTPDPLGAIAAMCRMYEGFPTYSLSDISHDERVKYWEQVEKTHLKAPLEAVKFHFFIEGVDRSFTHQMVRQRTAVYAQESMRFAVKDNMAAEVRLPPSIPAGTPEAEIFLSTVTDIQTGYDKLIDLGVPAEDARGLMPHATPTRLNYVTDLRALMDHAGNRLCTQAQFMWREVFSKMANAIAGYGDQFDNAGDLSDPSHFYAISNKFKPVCYQQGKCPFKADFDRGCTIRERVDAHEKKGTPSNEWNDINPAEFMLFHNSGYVKPGDQYGDQSHRM